MSYVYGRGNDLLPGQESQANTLRTPGIRSFVMDLLGFLNDLEKGQNELRCQLYGPTPEDPSAKGNPEPSGLEELLKLACQKAARLTHDQRELNARL